MLFRKKSDKPFKAKAMVIAPFSDAPFEEEIIIDEIQYHELKEDDGNLYVLRVLDEGEQKQYVIPKRKWESIAPDYYKTEKTDKMVALDAFFIKRIQDDYSDNNKYEMYAELDNYVSDDALSYVAHIMDHYTKNGGQLTIEKIRYLFGMTQKKAELAYGLAEDIGLVNNEYYDELLEDGINLASTHKYISPNLLIDELRIGRGRADRMIEELLKLGILGDYDEKTGIAKVINVPNKSSNDAQKTLYVKTIGILSNYKYIKTSDIQKEFNVGYSRASRVLEELANKGFIDKHYTKKGFKVL